MMNWSLILIGSGAILLLLAWLYAGVNVTRTLITKRQVTDFAGDVQAWLRSETY